MKEIQSSVVPTHLARSHRGLCTLLLGAALLMALSGCGQRGPLVRGGASTGPSAAAAASAPASSVR